MGYLINAWNETQKKFKLSLKQVVNIAGDGTLENDESIGELRSFFSLIDLNTMERLLGECFEKDRKFKFDTRGFAFQDLVNEMGRRLGCKVENGLYRGRKNEVGFDGLWTNDAGECLIVEVKTSDDYAISVESVTGYRDRIIQERRIPRRKCSILVVYGRDEKGGLRNTVKGSDEAKSFRLISATALFQLVRILAESKAPVIQKQIHSLLQPRDYFVLDNLVELVFPQTDASIPDIVDPDEMELPEGSGTAGTDSLKTASGHSVADLPPLPDDSLLIGMYVRSAMRNLADSGYVFTDDQIDRMCSSEWAKATFHTIKPFMKRYVPGQSDNKGEDGRIRFWSEVFSFGTIQVLVSKEWYTRQRGLFVSWYESLA